MKLARAFVVMMMVAGCDSPPPKAGDRCEKTGSAACQSSTVGLICGTFNSYKAVPCKGPNGCSDTGVNVRCDQSTGTMAGEGCFAAGDSVCDDAKMNILKCDALGVFNVDVACMNGDTCITKASSVQCGM